MRSLPIMVMFNLLDHQVRMSFSRHSQSIQGLTEETFLAMRVNPHQFNQFLAATDNYAEVLLHGLEQSPLEKASDHAKTLPTGRPSPRTTNSWANPKPPTPSPKSTPTSGTG